VNMNWLTEPSRGDASHGHVAVAQAILPEPRGSDRPFLGSFACAASAWAWPGVVPGLRSTPRLQTRRGCPQFVREFGLILVYTIGMQVGPGFVASDARVCP
jgi:hypothetical protein